jgi:hypothetical protein
MYRNFSDFAQTRPLASDFLVGFRPNQGEFKVDFYTISNLISGGLFETPNVLYVTVSGADTNIGVAENYPFKSIKRACAYAAAKPQNNYTIFVKSGTYYEKNPIYVPRNTTIHGDNLRRTNIIPLNPTYDILWLTNANYVWGVTFRNHRRPSAAVAFPNLDIAAADYAVAFNTTPLSLYQITPPLQAEVHNFNSPLYITTSPYVQGCSSITRSSSDGANDAGCGMRVDGDRVGGYLRSMVLDSYTQFNEGGEGIVVLNNGYAQLVSIFTIACTTAVVVSAGGGCDINTSNASFGLSGLAAFGRSNSPVITGTLVSNVSAGDNILVIDQVLPTRIAIIPAPLMVLNTTNYPNTYYTVTSALSTSTATKRVQLITDEDLVYDIPKGSPIKFYLRSSILASAYTMENVGSGTILSKALPVLGGVAKPDNEVCERDGGKIFVTLTNEQGDFKVGTDFTIRQATGTIEGRTFQRSIFSLITPFVLSIE